MKKAKPERFTLMQRVKMLERKLLTLEIKKCKILKNEIRKEIKDV